MKRRRGMYRACLGAAQAPEGRPGLQSSANTPAPQATHTPNPRRLPSLMVNFCRKGSAPGIGMMRPLACQALAHSPFDQHPLWVCGRFTYSEQEICAALRPANFSLSSWCLFSSQGLLGARSSARQCGQCIPFSSQWTLPGLVLTFFSPLESQRPSVTCRQPPTTQRNCLPVLASSAQPVTADLPPSQHQGLGAQPWGALSSRGGPCAADSTSATTAWELCNPVPRGPHRRQAQLVSSHGSTDTGPTGRPRWTHRAHGRRVVLTAGCDCGFAATLTSQRAAQRRRETSGPGAPGAHRNLPSHRGCRLLSLKPHLDSLCLQHVCCLQTQHTRNQEVIDHSRAHHWAQGRQCPMRSRFQEEHD